MSLQWYHIVFFKYILSSIHFLSLIGKPGVLALHEGTAFLSLSVPDHETSTTNSAHRPQCSLLIQVSSVLTHIVLSDKQESMIQIPFQQTSPLFLLCLLVSCNTDDVTQSWIICTYATYTLCLLLLKTVHVSTYETTK